MRDDEQDPEAPEIVPGPGLFDPRPFPPGLDVPDLIPVAPDSDESPDVDPPAWEGSEPDEPTPGLIDPRPEIPTPDGM